MTDNFEKLKNFVNSTKVLRSIKEFFLPPPGAPLTRRVMPYALLGVATLLLFIGGTYAWDYTNSPVFCGTSCHTMPPEYAAYEVSPHARVDCVECHIGRGFFAERVTRKAGDAKHIIALAFKQYEFPITANDLRPARETCELCHYPSKFSDDSLRRKTSYKNDKDNTLIYTYLAMRTGGGSQREGLGRGIHWHIENEVWYAATDQQDQNIPYIKSIDADGVETIYMALDTEYSQEELEEIELVRMDCLTCHNRISHNILPPSRAIDQAITRGQISRDIPYIRYYAVEMLNELSENLISQESAEETIWGLADYYAEEYPEFYAENADLVDQALETMVAIYEDTVFKEQKVNWSSHANNLGHKDWPGCFRCHDGQHVSESGQAVRLECNICHSIPEVVSGNVLEPVLPLATGNEPASHFSTHWINLHRTQFDDTCQACHTVDDPGGTSNTSFCSNSACHGTAWEYAELDAPGIAKVLAEDEPVVPEDESGIDLDVDAPTFDDQIGALFKSRCTSCHNSTIATGGLVLESYDQAMRGGSSGPVIFPGDPEESLIVIRQRDGHFANFTSAELQLLIQWIKSGAPAN